MSTCSRCGKAVTAQGIAYGDQRLCRDCAEALEQAPVACPACGTLTDGEHMVSLLLTLATATPSERLCAQNALVHICPRCHVLFFDSFQYGLLAGLTTGS